MVTSRIRDLEWEPAQPEHGTTGFVCNVHYGGISTYRVFPNGAWMCFRKHAATEFGTAEDEQAALKLCNNHWRTCVENFILGLNFDKTKL
jgi:hypothetical protein